ncbi:hypothetical protein RJT34_23627 [Clitoria ternatea]|uniref:Shugoshin C-terminal domain-containing protein n=1 Tax=Clitoria ternatea TaxID=43366 RepID=A0AAN9FSM6_CLITE
MEGVGGSGIFLDSDSEHVGVAGAKARKGKGVKGDSVSVLASQKKMLSDITNLAQQQQHPQQAKQQLPPLAAPDISFDQLLKENAMLMKLLANRNAIIESCKAELQKCQNDFMKLRKQNSELAQTNNQMLAELNISRQRLREIQHELGGKNGILKAMKLELEAKKHTVKLKHVDAHEVGAYLSNQSDQSLPEHNRKDVKMKRASKSQSSAQAVVKQVKSVEKVDNQRYSLRRQSAGLKTEKPESTKDSVQGEQVKDDVSRLQENLANENVPTSLGTKIHEEAREDTESSGPANTEQVHAKKKIENKRTSLRRQTNRFRPENPEPTEDFFEIDDSVQGDQVKDDVSCLQENLANENGPTSLGTQIHEEAREDTESSEPANTEQVHAKKKIDNKRISLRRQTNRFRPENPEPTEDFFEIDDSKFNVSHLSDSVSETNRPTPSSVASKQENEAFTFEYQEGRRSSVGRPLRRTVGKIMSYKEIPLNKKMRREN